MRRRCVRARCAVVAGAPFSGPPRVRWAGPMSSVEWVSNPLPGVFTRFGPPETRAQDPAVALWAGSLAACGPRAQSVEVGGAGWTDQDAHDACVGEAIERFQTYVLPLD